MQCINELRWEKMQGLIPAVVQDTNTRRVLMVGYMNQAALERTIQTKQVTFFSRSRNALWRKGETSGNTLELVHIVPDCDQDALLILANPTGPVCHKNTPACFADERLKLDWEVILQLESEINERERLRPEVSYTASLFNQGISRIAQKVGEEAVEVVIAAMEADNDALCDEMADLLFHSLVLLKAKKMNFSSVIQRLRER